MSRMVVLKNMSDAGVELRESSRLAPPGSYSYRIQLPPFGHREIPAARFHNRNLGRGQPATIILYVNGQEITSTCLMAQDFLRYVKLSLYVDQQEEGSPVRLTITGIKPKLTDFCRFWGLGFLGREYEGRDEEIIR